MMGRALRTAADSAPPALPVSAAIQKAKSFFGLSKLPGEDGHPLTQSGSAD